MYSDASTHLPAEMRLATNRMNAPKSTLLPEVLLGPQPADQPSLDLATEGVQRFVWQSAYGAMLIEVRDGVAYVNGGRVMSIHELRAGHAET